MIHDALQTLANYIRTNNPYLNNVYSEVVQHILTGYVQTHEEVIFPNDTLGNYAYLRVPNAMQFEDGPQYEHSEGVLNVGLRLPVVLVAVMRGADEEQLLENLITTLMQYSASMPEPYIKLTSATYQKDVIVINELAKVPKNDVRAAIGKIDDDMVMASLSFVFTIPYQYKQLACIQTP
jgi:hypothetical protein